jgi:hypothetical protein
MEHWQKSHIDAYRAPLNGDILIRGRLGLTRTSPSFQTIQFLWQ